MRSGVRFGVLLVGLSSCVEQREYVVEASALDAVRSAPPQQCSRWSMAQPTVVCTPRPALAARRLSVRRDRQGPPSREVALDRDFVPSKFETIPGRTDLVRIRSRRVGWQRVTAVAMMIAGVIATAIVVPVSYQWIANGGCRSGNVCVSGFAPVVAFYAGALALGPAVGGGVGLLITRNDGWDRLIQQGDSTDGVVGRVPPPENAVLLGP